MALKTDYKEDILASGNTRRKYNMITNDDGTVSLEDVTDYTQVGDSFGAGDINVTNNMINTINSLLHYKSVLVDVSAQVIGINKGTTTQQLTRAVPRNADELMVIFLGTTAPLFAIIPTGHQITTGKETVTIDIKCDTSMMGVAPYTSVDTCNLSLMYLWFKYYKE